MKEKKMQQHFIDNEAEKLILFFSGWGCDEHQFKSLKDKNFDILICFDYSDLSLDFDFSKYKEINVIAYSAGVMISSLFMPKLPHLHKKIAINGNPYLFDKTLGIPSRILEVFQNITMDNYMDFRREYMVFDDEEFKLYNEYESQRCLQSCAEEYNALLNFYEKHKETISFDFDTAIFSDRDEIFNLESQKSFYKEKIKILSNAKHHLFFRFSSFEEILELNYTKKPLQFL